MRGRVNFELQTLLMRLVCLLGCLLASAAAWRCSPPVCSEAKPRRQKKNKYAQFSKADEVRKSLRFSRIDDVPMAGAEAAAKHKAAPVVAAPRERDVWTYPDAAEVDQRDPTTFGFVEIGRVLGAHGVKGEVKVLSESDFTLERLCTPGARWMRRPKRRAPREVRLVHGRTGPGTGVFIVQLADVRQREEAQTLKGATLYSRQEIVPELEDDELLLSQLEGLTVVMAVRSGGEAGEWEAGEEVGRVLGVIPREELTGNPELGHDLLEIELFHRGEDDDDEHDDAAADASSAHADDADGEEGEEEEEEEEELEEPDTVLVPYVSEIVPDVLLDRGLVLIDPPAGLLELVQPKKKVRIVIRGLLPERAQSLLEQ